MKERDVRQLQARCDSLSKGLSSARTCLVALAEQSCSLSEEKQTQMQHLSKVQESLDALAFERDDLTAKLTLAEKSYSSTLEVVTSHTSSLNVVQKEQEQAICNAKEAAAQTATEQVGSLSRKRSALKIVINGLLSKQTIRSRGAGQKDNQKVDGMSATAAGPIYHSSNQKSTPPPVCPLLLQR